MRLLPRASLILGLAAIVASAQNGQFGYPPQNGPQGFPPAQQAPSQGYPQNGNSPNGPQGSDPNDAATDADSASHGVGRLSLMNGAVSVAHGDAGQMAGAVVNAPVVTSDRVLTGADGRAEVEFDGANLVRVAGLTELRMGDLQFKRIQVQIAQGLVTFRVLRDNDTQVEISTPTVAVHPLRQGTYRVSVSPDGQTEVTVRAGEAEIESPTGSEQLHAGQTMQSRGSTADPEFRTTAAPAPDDWDRFNADRDRMFENNDNSRYVSPDIYGAEDLGNYGRWSYDPPYGNVWIPNEGPDWAPYQDGRWTDLDYYGWTWVSYDPWGWAPYHYGRWYRGSYGWAWYPGAIGPHYRWRPALVGFFGWGAPGFGVSVGFGFGHVGWVPLAPFEAFHPWYGRGFGGVRNTAIVNNTNVANVYRNARVNGGVTSMRAGEFGRSGVTGATMARVSAADLSHAGMMSGGVPVSAGREGRMFSASTGNFQGMPRTNQNTHFYSAPATRTAVSPSTGAAGFAGASGANGSGQRSPAGGVVTGGASAGGWRRFDPATNSAHGQGSQSGGGFQRPAGGGFQPGANFSRGGGFQSPSNGLAGGGSRPVQIAPPIVNNRGAQGSAAPRPSGSPSGGFGGFGGPRPNGGGGSSAPRASQGGGGFRGGAPSGGGGHAGGGHSGGGRR